MSYPLLGFFLMFFIAGCTFWPPNAHDGNLSGDTAPPARAYKLTSSKNGQAQYTAIYAKLVYNRHQVERLQKNGAAQCFPALYQQLIWLQARGNRELRNELYDDARRTIAKMTTKIQSLDQKMQSLSPSTECRNNVQGYHSLSDEIAEG